jgi:predicted ester cyclase
MQVIEVELLEENGLVADRVVWTATHTGDFMGIPATGKQIKVSEMHINRFEGGKLAERWGAWDQLGMMQQLGVIPMPEQ